jgi:hypothetical protein
MAHAVGFLMPIFFMITHCWAIDSKLFQVQ